MSKIDKIVKCLRLFEIGDVLRVLICALQNFTKIFFNKQFVAQKLLDGIAFEI